MNDSTRTQLKIIVERAVRPVRASTSRKRTMREEMLTHVAAAFEEEAKLGGSEAAMLERTAQRFGAPVELARQLQAAVPTSDVASWFIETLIGFPPREPALRMALRHALMTGVICTVGLAVMIVIIGHWSEWLTFARLPAILMPVYMGVLIFGASLLGRGMSEALFGPGGRDWPRAFAIGVAAWLLVPGVTLVWCYALSGALVASLLEVLPLLLLGLLAPLVLLLTVYACITEIRHHEEWASLKID